MADIERQFKSAFTSKTQELAAQRAEYEAAQEQLQFLQALENDPDIQVALLKELAQVHGVDLPDFSEAPETETEAQDDFHDPRLDALLAELDTERQNAEYENFLTSVESHVADELTALSQEAGRELSEAEQELITNTALAAGLNEQGLPDLRSAFDQLRQVEAAWQSRWLDSKKAPQMSTGTAGSLEQDLNDTDTRLRVMAQLVEAHSSHANT